MADGAVDALGRWANRGRCCSCGRRLRSNLAWVFCAGCNRPVHSTVRGALCGRCHWYYCDGCLDIHRGLSRAGLAQGIRFGDIFALSDELVERQPYHDELADHGQGWWIRVLWTCIAVVGGLTLLGFGKFCSCMKQMCCTRRQHHASTQSQTTYSSVRRATTGIFEVVPEALQGVWWND